MSRTRRAEKKIAIRDEHPWFGAEPERGPGPSSGDELDRELEQLAERVSERVSARLEKFTGRAAGLGHAPRVAILKAYLGGILTAVAADLVYHLWEDHLLLQQVTLWISRVSQM